MSLPQDGAAGVLGVTGVVVSFFSICVDTSFEGMRGHAHALSPLYAPGAGKEPCQAQPCLPQVPGYGMMALSKHCC